MESILSFPKHPINYNLVQLFLCLPYQYQWGLNALKKGVYKTMI